MPNVTDRCFEFFRSVGMTTMFGNPGSTEEPFLQNFPADFRYVLGLHEAGVVGMATGYALAGDQAALVNLHTAAGMGNAMAAIINASHSKAPLIITAGQQHRAMEMIEPLLWGKQVEFVRPYVKWSYEPHRAVDVPAALVRAYHLAMSAPRGPVFVSICMDGLDEECPATPPRVVAGVPSPDPSAIERIAQTLRASKRVALIVGEELDAAEVWPSTIALAERLKAAVFGPPENFRVGFPTGHPQFQGFLPPAIQPLADRLAGFDALLVLGTRMFAYYPYAPGPFMPEGIKVHHVTTDPAEAARAVAGDAVVGCSRRAVRMLLDLISDDPGRADAPRAPQPPTAEPSEPMTAAFVYKTLADRMPPRTVIVQESLSSIALTQKLIPLSEPGSYFTTSNGILGSALPMAIGVRMAQPDRPAVCLLGDGAAQYSIQGLWTAAHQGLPVVFLVLDNSEYAILKAFGNFLKTPNVPGLDLGRIDFAGLAAGYGLTYHGVEHAGDLADTLSAAFAAEGPILVHVPIDPKVPSLIG